jgi:LPXTG-site transpeptidase (sortase) family protein
VYNYLMTNAVSSSQAAPKARITFHHNVLPFILGVSMFASVLGLLNAGWIIAQWQYHVTPPATAAVISQEVASAAPSKADDLIIPSIKVQAPVNFTIPDLTEWKIQIGLREGVVHLGNTAKPGQKGNVVIVGHSSGQVWSPGHYKFVFTMLDKLKPGDRIIIDYQGTRYIYKVTGSEIIDPTNLGVLQQRDKSELSLITCTPVGTSKNRLVIHADQISPNPANNTSTNDVSTRKIDKLPQ